MRESSTEYVYEQPLDYNLFSNTSIHSHVIRCYGNGSLVNQRQVTLNDRRSRTWLKPEILNNILLLQRKITSEMRLMRGFCIYLTFRTKTFIQCRSREVIRQNSIQNTSGFRNFEHFVGVFDVRSNPNSIQTSTS